MSLSGVLHPLWQVAQIYKPERLSLGHSSKQIQKGGTQIHTYEIVLNLTSDLRNEGLPYVEISTVVQPNCLGTTVQNLELISPPNHDSGELSMLSFVPSIVILDYLSETDVVANSVKSKILKHLQTGFQNQLKFKRSDGWFGVWNRQDSEGSTSLTAFVAKSFILASRYIDTDETDEIDDAFNWLVDVQQSDGRFEEIGQVYHADIQSGIRNNSIALTSYVLIAFLENPDNAANHTPTVRRALRFLPSIYDEIDDSYDLALTTYAFSLAGHPKAKQALDDFIDQSIHDEESGLRYWNRTSASVEIAGYAILSHMKNKPVIGVMEIVQWLTQQRYGQGSYGGVQDTIVGLEALTKFSAQISSKKNDYRVTIWHKPYRTHTFDVDKNDTFSIQELDIPSHVRQIRVEIVGVGYGMFQVAYQYYMSIERARPSFKINVEVLKRSNYYVQHLQVCVNYIPREAYQRSNMTMIEVFFPSWLVRLIYFTCQLQKTELRFAATSVVVYYNSLNSDARCFRVTAYRRYKVANNRPANVVVYDLYGLDRFAVKSYQGIVAQLCDICEDEECESLSCR
ncbi:thioester-containing protein 1 allele S3-like [Toxorhynchites rutilus septentrionalis]|uniref:thioester-containing protein 1 allele S3-like n=1 Tax=Toxorhynchites rutilus septentrionalis TaxID=329112 RepID=UPI002479870F|nr:thioester-containing protein 1 allele S3-like [Toxorhynchites rutilus septentrionalis]